MPNEYPYPPIGAPLKLAVSNTSVSERAPLKTRRGTATIPWLGHADGHTAAPFSSARSTFLRPNLHRKKIRPRSPPPRYHSPRGTPTLPAKVQGGVVGGDHLAGQRSKVGCGPGTLRSHLAGYLDKVLSGRPTFPVHRAFTTGTCVAMLKGRRAIVGR